jgi:hypothetical protein
MGAAVAPIFYIKRATAPRCTLNSALWASGFLAILHRLAASLRQPCKNGKNHSPKAPHFRLHRCPGQSCGSENVVLYWLSKRYTSA